MVCRATASARGPCPVRSPASLRRRVRRAAPRPESKGGVMDATEVALRRTSWPGSRELARVARARARHRGVHRGDGRGGGAADRTSHSSPAQRHSRRGRPLPHPSTAPRRPTSGRRSARTTPATVGVPLDGEDSLRVTALGQPGEQPTVNQCAGGQDSDGETAMPACGRSDSYDAEEIENRHVGQTTLGGLVTALLLLLPLLLLPA